MRNISTPIDHDTLLSLRAGDEVLLSGIVLTGRDAAHKRMHETLSSGGTLPVDISGQTIYYLGPTPAAPGQVIGSAGPTTSGRMDKYTPLLLAHGLRAMIGKGDRSQNVIDAMREHSCVYFAAIGGAGALLSRCIKSAETIAYEDLGTEAIRRLRVEGFPCIVAIDAQGGDVYRRDQL